MRNIVLGIGLLFGIYVAKAQQDSIIKLKEVVVSDIHISRYTDGHKLTTLKDSLIKESNGSLTSLLNFNSTIYFKENGFGMVSSPAFRGTNASHTAVIWNGININSQLNGQVDFNTINPYNYSSIDIRSGGGSVQYGSGAIGGSVHLTNTLRFDTHFENQIALGYGSFDTRKINYTQSLGTGKWSSSIGVNYNASENDYIYLETNEKNKNGDFRNLNLNVNAGYILNDKQVLKLYHQTFIGDRNFSGNIVVKGRSKYKNNQYRTQVAWGFYGNKVVSKIKLAHLKEEYKYFENKDSDIYSFGKVGTTLARYSIDAKLSDSFRVNSFLEYKNYNGKGGSFGNPKRDDFSATALVKHSISPKLEYNLSIRQDVSSSFSSPLVYSLDGKYAVNTHYSFLLNASKNFRTPTFNDLYWQPGGNLDLVSETSYQIDLGHRLSYGGFIFKVNSYYISTNDMIKWLPGDEGFWTPININKVQIYGAEATLEYENKIRRNQHINFTTNYGYTVSEDTSTNTQLIYVPFHQGNAALAYSVSGLRLFYQYLYTGSVSIIGGNLKEYQVSNMGLTYSGRKQKKSLKYTIGLTIHNLFNTYYENIALRPMPNRNIQTQLILNF